MSANVPTRALGQVPENAPQSGWAAWLVQIARLANFLLKSLGTTPITAIGDAAYPIVQSDRLVETSAAFTAARIWTLPPAGSVDAGYEIAIVDAIATITAANTLTVALSGADTIDNSATAPVLNTAGASLILVSDGLSNWAVKAGRGARAITQSTPANPTGTTNTTGVMMGLAGSITPRQSGTILLVISGVVQNNVLGDGWKVQLRYGTGGAPANGAALTGTAVGAQQAAVVAGAGDNTGFSLNAVITGLTAGTAYWLDLSLAAITGGTATVGFISISAIEQPT